MTLMSLIYGDGNPFSVAAPAANARNSRLRIGSKLSHRENPRESAHEARAS
jgi:hypothetical protein